MSSMKTAVAAGCAFAATRAFVFPSSTGTAAPARVGASASVDAATGLGGPSHFGLAVVGAAALAAVPAARRGRAAVEGRRPVARHFAPQDEPGVQAPVGFWDPLDLCADGPEVFKRRRAVELKHGRVCMYACIGYIVPEYFRWPGYLSPSQGLKFTDVPNGLAALSKVPALGWAQIIAFCGIIEKTGFTFTEVKDIGFQKDASMAGEPGNYGLGFIGAFNQIPSVPANRTKKLNAELANGRLAMTAIMAMLFQDGTVGGTGPEMWWFEQPPEYAMAVGDFIPKDL